MAAETYEALRIGLGREIRALRARRDWSQSDLAAHVDGASGNWISTLELGQANPTFERLVAVACALDVTPGELLAGALRIARQLPVRR